MNDVLEGKKHYTRKINVKAKGNFPKNLWGLWGSEEKWWLHILEPELISKHSFEKY